MLYNGNMSTANFSYPVLYSSRKNPFAIRARMALFQSGHTIELREIDPKNPPDDVLDHTDDPSVPIFIPSPSTVLDDSVDIMEWALNKKDPDFWLVGDKAEMTFLIERNDEKFTPVLDRMRHPKRYDKVEVQWAKDVALSMFEDLEDRLDGQRYLLGAQLSLADIALFPFILRFKAIDFAMFEGLPYTRIHQWLAELSSHKAFESVMGKMNIWTPGDPPILLAPWGRG